MIFFAHVQRTAGTTIHKQFESAFERPARLARGSRHLVVSGNGELAFVAETTRELPDRNFYLGGHVGLHDLAYNGIPVERGDVVFTTVRDVVQRAVSLYYLVLRSPDWIPHLAEIISRGFEYFYDFCRGGGNYCVNDHCRLLSGSESFDDTVACIERDFNLVGSVEHMGAVEQAIFDICRPVAPGLTMKPMRENAAFHRRESGMWCTKAEVSELVSPSLAARILRENDGDVQLIDWVKMKHGGVFRNAAKAQ